MSDAILSGGIIGILTTVAVALILCGCAALIFWIVFGPDLESSSRGARGGKHSGLYLEVMGFSLLAVLASSVLFFLSLRTAERASQTAPPQTAAVVALPAPVPVAAASAAADTHVAAPAEETSPAKPVVAAEPPAKAPAPAPAASATPEPPPAPEIAEIAPAAGPSAPSPPAPATEPVASAEPGPAAAPSPAAAPPAPAAVVSSSPSPAPVPSAATATSPASSGGAPATGAAAATSATTGAHTAAATPPPQAANRPPAAAAPDAGVNPEVAALMQRGDALRDTGDVVSARLFYERAAEDGSAVAARAVGETYDPLVLEDEHVRGVPGDSHKAIDWYRKAILGGDAAAVERLHRLTASLSG